MLFSLSKNKYLQLTAFNLTIIADLILCLELLQRLLEYI